jgi:hypothetical protein
MFESNNKPPCNPKPLVTTVKEEISFKIQYINTIIATLLYKIAISRLLVTALDNNMQNIEEINIY